MPIPKGYEYISGTKNTGVLIGDIASKTVKANGEEDYLLKFIWVPVDDTTVGDIKTAKEALAGMYTENNISVSEIGVTTYLKNKGKEYTKANLQEGNAGYLNELYKEETIAQDIIDSINLYKGFYVSQAEMGYEVDAGKIVNPYSNISRDINSPEATYAASGDYYRGFTELAEAGQSGKLKVTDLQEFSNNGINVNKTDKGITLSYDSMKTIAGKVGKTLDNKTITTSHMAYGAEWDAIMVWLIKTAYADKDNNTSESNALKVLQDSTTIGKYANSRSLWSQFFEKTYSNNIWGLAGNLAEVTQEVRKDGSYVLRGGAFNHTGNNYPMASRFVTAAEDGTGFNDFTKKDNVGFRACLCIGVK